jgi:hypothetical protein
MHGERSWSIDSIEKVIPCIHHHQGKIDNFPKPRIIKSHFFPPKKYPRVVFLVRDGRDVCVEYYDRCTKLDGYQYGFETFVKKLCQGKIWPGAWHRHALAWLASARRLPFLLVKYEDLLAHTETQLSAILDFVGIRATHKTIQAAVAKATPETYRNLHREIQRYRIRSFTGGVSATYGAWKSVFSDDLNAFFVNYAGKALKSLGYREDRMHGAPSPVPYHRSGFEPPDRNAP